MTTKDYTKQAEDFLAKYGIGFRATLRDSKPCPWKNDDNIATGEGHHYRVTLSKQLGFGDVRRLTFDFWGSYADAKAGKLTIDAYDVLACLSSDAQAGDEFTGFGEWCDNYGYDRDSIKALQTYRRCAAFGKRLRAFFTTEELQALSEIQ